MGLLRFAVNESTGMYDASSSNISSVFHLGHHHDAVRVGLNTQEEAEERASMSSSVDACYHLDPSVAALVEELSPQAPLRVVHEPICVCF